MNTLFVGWAAVSSAAQATEEKNSIENQLYENYMHSRRHGKMLCQFVVDGQSRSITKLSDACLTVTGWRFDVDLTGEKDESIMRRIESEVRLLRESAPTIHPYAELDNLIEQGKFDVFIFRNLGRVGRSAALAMTIMALCQEQDILTYATATPPSSLRDAGATYHRALIDALTAVGYENEVRELTIKHRDGIIRRTERGLFPGRTPWGWQEIRNDKGRIVGYEIDEDAAITIRLIVDKYLTEGWGISKICDHLNAIGRPRPSGEGAWQLQNVVNVLNLVRRYAGINEINRHSKRRRHVEAPGKWPAIISEDTARAVEDERVSRAPSRRAVNNGQRYSRLVYCAKCGQRMWFRNATVRHQRKDGKSATYSTRQYRCPNMHGDCSEKKITKALRDAIRRIEKEIDATNVVGRTMTPPPTETTTQEAIDAIHEQIARIKAGIAKADTDYYVHLTIDEQRHNAIIRAANERAESLLVELNQLQERLHEEEQAGKRTERIDEIRNVGAKMLTEKNIGMANAWLRRHFKVYCTGGKVEHVVLL